MKRYFIKSTMFYMTLILALMGFVFLSNGWAENTIDMSDMLLKVKDPAFFTCLGSKGFSIYDWGSEKLKFFNWKFQLIKQIPLTRGEGPDQVMQNVLAAYIVKERIFLIGLMENKIKIFDRDGKFIKSIPLEMMAKDMIYQQEEEKLYIFNLQISAADDSFLLAKVIDPNSTKPVKNIMLKGKMESSKLLDGNAIMIGIASIFAMEDNKKIYLVISSANALYEIDENGKFLRKVSLPYEERKIIRTTKENGEDHTTLSVLDSYTNMKVIQNNLYICFLRHIKKDKKTGADLYQTHILKYSGEGFAEKIIDGNNFIMGEHEGNLYLFNIDDYQATVVNLLEWKVKK
jgi:hypothetical protein